MEICKEGKYQSWARFNKDWIKKASIQNAIQFNSNLERNFEFHFKGLYGKRLTITYTRSLLYFNVKNEKMNTLPVAKFCLRIRFLNCILKVIMSFQKFQEKQMKLLPKCNTVVKFHAKIGCGNSCLFLFKGFLVDSMDKFELV